MKYFEYDSNAKNYLKKVDPILGKAIDDIGDIKREVTPDLFEGLISSIIAQQISSKAADTVWSRFEKLCSPVTPRSVSQTTPEMIQAQGMSMRKAKYIHQIACMVVENQLDLESLSNESDETISKLLKSLPGIGVWTAEMLMIFSMQRPDIVSWDDLAIRRGMMKLYGLDTLDKATFMHYKQTYSPYGSVASLYLWAISVRE